MEKELYWIWLSTKSHSVRIKLAELIRYFDSIEELYEATDYSSIEGITSQAKNQLEDKNLDKAKQILDACQEKQIQVVPFDNDAYPPLLRSISDPPAVLYARGKLRIYENSLPIAVVGTRKCTQYGIDACKVITKDLVNGGAITVSGLAFGIDAFAAEATIENDGYTIAVLGTGIDIIYPRHNINLANKILETGAIISEFPPGTRGAKWTFPMRNRIISGISRGTLVVEAPNTSGALGTAEHALEQGRDVFCVPGDIFAIQSVGTNRLIAEGAMAVRSAQDILSQYPDFKPNKKIDEEQQELPQMNDNEKKIYELLLYGEKHIDTLARETLFSMTDLQHTLLSMELNEMVRHKIGNVYALIERN